MSALTCENAVVAVLKLALAICSLLSTLSSFEGAVVGGVGVRVAHHLCGGWCMLGGPRERAIVSRINRGGRIVNMVSASTIKRVYRLSVC